MTGPITPRLIPAGAALAAYAIAARARKEERGRVRDVASVAGTAFLFAALWALLPPAVVAPAWALLALGLLGAGLRWNLSWLRWQSYALAVLAFARCWAANFAGAADLVLAGAAVIACFYVALRAERKMQSEHCAMPPGGRRPDTPGAVARRLNSGRLLWFTITFRSSLPAVSRKTSAVPDGAVRPAVISWWPRISRK